MVVFDEEQGVEVVPVCWLNDDESRCRWPNEDVKGQGSLVLKGLPIHNRNSSYYNCRVLCKTGKELANNM